MHAHHYLNKNQPTRYKLDGYMGMVESSIFEYIGHASVYIPLKDYLATIIFKQAQLAKTTIWKVKGRFYSHDIQRCP